MPTKNKIFSPVFQAFLIAAIVVCLCESYNVPLSWGRHDLPQCIGMMGNRDLYEDVARICSDCQNVFRDKNVESKCRSDCFSSSYFETCILALELAEKLTDFKMHASILKDGRK